MYKIIDDCTTRRANCFESEPIASLAEAIERALDEWDELSGHDKRDRDAFYVAEIGPGDGVITWQIVDVPFVIK